MVVPQGIGDPGRTLRLAAGLTMCSRRSIAALVMFLFPSWYRPDRKYRSEERLSGPGPRWQRQVSVEGRVVSEELNPYCRLCRNAMRHGAKAALAILHCKPLTAAW